MLKRYSESPGNNASLTWQSETDRKYSLELFMHPNDEATFDLRNESSGNFACSNLTKKAAAELIEWLQEFVDG